jgi:hypothetical protein
MEPVALVFGLACVGCMALSTRAPGRAPLFCATLLTGLWAAANVLWLLNAMEALPLLDLPVACLALVLWHERGRDWQASLSAVLAARMVLHLVGQWGVIGIVAYLHTANALFLAALAAVSWTGGIDELCARIGRFCRVRMDMAQTAALAERQAS